MTPVARSSLTARADDTPVAPYLTHVITHHGQVTLVPPQNQGRLRTNKRTRKLKATRTEQSNPSTSSLSVSSLGSATSQPKKRRKPKINVAQTASENGLSGDTASESQILTSRLAPPPSYDSLRSESALSTNSDVTSFKSGSSSSDDFEDITQVDFESQWELDRMAGFTLEERVRREWHRRQASITRTARPANVQALSSPHLIHRTPSHNDDILSEFSTSTPPPPPPKDISRDPETVPLSTHSSQPSLLESGSISLGRSWSCSPVVSSKNILQNTQDTERNLSKSSLEDWDILEPIRINTTQSLTPRSRNPALLNKPRSPIEKNELSTDSDSIPASLGINPGNPVLTEWKCDPPRSAAQQVASFNGVTAALSCADSSFTEPQETILPRTSRKGKEREVQSVSDTTSKLSAIHRRPLPTPPITPRDPHSTHPVASSSKASPSFWPQSASDATSAADPPVSIFDSEPRPVAVISPSFGCGRIASMRDRPVPPPPAEFLARARTKRKPPPPPPSSYRYGVSELRSPDPTRVNPLDNMAKNPPQDGIAESVTISHHGQPTSEMFRLPRPVSQELHSLPSPSSISQQGGLVSNTTSPVLNIDGTSSRACGLGPVPPSRAATECSVSNADSQDTPAQVEQPMDEASARLPEEMPVSTTLIDSPRTLPVDPSIADGSPADVMSSALPVPEGALGPYTDLDILLSRLDDASSGNRYEDLLIVSELLGPAQPQSTPSQSVGDLPLGRIEVLRRRKLQDGRVKLKLSLFGVMVDRCGICLSQFKNGEWAVLLPCVHPFHSTCLQSWLARNHTCPLCRVTLDIS